MRAGLGMNKHSSTPDGPFSAVTFKEPERAGGSGTWPARWPRTPVPSYARRDAGAGRKQGDRLTKRLFPPPAKTFFIKLLLYSSPTSFLAQESFRASGRRLSTKCCGVTVLRTAHEHHPVVGEALHGGLFPHLGAVPQLQLHLHGTLRAGGGETAVNNRKATVRH